MPPHGAHPYGRRADPPRRRGIGRYFLYAIAGLLLLLVAGVGAVLLAPPTDLVRAKVAAEVERQTGRKLTIGGAGVSLWSGLGVTLERVVLSAPPAMGGAPLIKADRVDVNVAILPFILREVKVERLSLVRPVIDLRVDGEGRRSWDFASGVDHDRRPIRYAQAAGGTNDASRLPPELREFAKGGTPPGSSVSKGLKLDGLSFADVRVTGGTLLYSDAKAGMSREVTGIDANISLPRIGGPLDVAGHIVVAGERLAVDGRIDAVSELLAEQPVRVRLKIDGKPVALSYQGTVAAGGKSPAAHGNLDLKAPSAFGLARLVELPLPGLEALGAISVAGNVKASPEGFLLTSANLGLGETMAAGSLQLETGNARPLVKANLSFGRLDVDRFLALASGEAAAPATTPGRFAAPPVAGTPPDGPATGAAPTSIDDLLKRSVPGSAPSGPQVRGWRSGQGNQWSVEAIDLAAFRQFDLDGRFQIAELLWSGIRGSQIQAAAELKAGHLRANVTDGEVAGGKVRGLTSIDARKAQLVVGANLSGDAVAVGPLLKAAGVDLMEGRGRTVVTLSARGASERELVSTLSGKVDFRVTDGSLVGWNAEAMLAGLRRGEFPSTRRSPEARTPFSRLSGTFDITNGVGRTRDLMLESPAATATGTGLVNIVDRNLDLTVRPKVVGGGVEIPVRIAGSWDDPSIVPDVAGALNSPAAQEAVRQLKDGNVDGALRSVLGDGPKAEKKIDRAKDFLRQFLQQ